MKKILIFTRPWMTKFYKELLARSVLKDFKQSFITEFIKEAQKLQDCNYISYKKEPKTHYAYRFFTDEEIFDIIKRDRYLVTCNFSKALENINTITEQLLEIYDDFNPDIVFGHTVDTYIHDIFYRIAIKKGIFQFSMVWGGVVNNTFKFYNYITPIKRTVPNEKIDLFKVFENKREDISNPIIKQFDLITRVFNKVNYVKLLVKIYNPFNIDKHNIYFEFRRSKTVALPYLNFRDLFNNYYINFSEIPNSNSKLKKIYISLHYVPEATLNNFSKNNSLVNHDQIILDILQKYHEKYIFIVKEHPAMYGKRNLRFYDKIKKFQNVYLVHPKFKYYEIFKSVDYVLSWGGTVGVEAPFFNVKPLNISKPYYHIDGYDNYFESYQDVIENFSSKLEALNYNNEQYCRDLNELMKTILFDGKPSEQYSEDDNLVTLAQEIDYLIKDTYGLV